MMLFFQDAINCIVTETTTELSSTTTESSSWSRIELTSDTTSSIEDKTTMSIWITTTTDNEHKFTTDDTTTSTWLDTDTTSDSTNTFTASSESSLSTFTTPVSSTASDETLELTNLFLNHRYLEYHDNSITEEQQSPNRESELLTTRSPKNWLAETTKATTQPHLKFDSDLNTL